MLITQKSDKYGYFQVVTPLNQSYNPVISVIISVFNGQESLLASIRSLLSQTITDIEVIVVDDGSTDSSGSIIKSLQNSDNRITLIEQSNVGLTISLNRALTVAKGVYIARQDADDLSLPFRLEKQLDIIKTKKYGLLVSRALKNNKIIPSKILLSHVDLNTLTLGNVFIHGTFFCEATIFKKIMYDNKLRYAQDIDFVFRLIKSGKNIGYILDPLYVLGCDGSNISFKFKQAQLDCFKESARTNGNIFLCKLFFVHKISRHIFFTLRVIVMFYSIILKRKKNYVDLVKIQVPSRSL